MRYSAATLSFNAATRLEKRGQRRQEAHLAASHIFVTSSERRPSVFGGAQPMRFSVRFTSRRQAFRFTEPRGNSCTDITADCARGADYQRLAEHPQRILASTQSGSAA